MALQALLIGRCFCLGLRLGPRLLALAALLVFVEPVYGSLAVARLHATEDTRIEARRWLEANAEPGSVCCNFGGWAGDPPVRTVEDIWWKVSQLVGSTASVDVGQALRYLDRHAPPSPFYSFVVQHGNRGFASGRLDLVTGFGCDYVLLHEHRLSYSTVDPAFRSALSRLASRVAGFGDPLKGGVGQAYDPIDAYFVPVAGFADVHRPGPHVEIWRTGQDSGGRPANWTARHIFARAFLRGAASLLDQGHAEPARHMMNQALQAAGQSQDDWLLTEAARLRRRLGESAGGS